MALNNRKHTQRHELMNIDALFAFLYCTLASTILTDLPIIGGAMYLATHCAVVFFQSRRNLRQELISKYLRITGIVLVTLVALLSLALITLSPISIQSGNFWLETALVLFVILRKEISRYGLEKSALEKRKTSAILFRLALVQLLFLPFIALILFLSPIGRNAAWALLGGYAISGLLECLSLNKVRYTLRGYTDDEKDTLQKLSKVHAYRIYQNTALVMAAAMQITLVIVYTYLAVTAETMIVSMVLGMLCTYAAFFSTDALLKKRITKSRDQSILICIGLAVWLGGLINFICTLDHPTMWQGAISLVLCTVGATVCTRSMSRMESDMQRVAIFGLGKNPGRLLGVTLHFKLEYATLLGQLIALLGLLLISVFSSGAYPADWESLFLSFSPLLTLPAVCLVTVTLIFALMFPMTWDHITKLRRYLDLQAEGKENLPLKNQLEAVVVKKSLKHYGIRLIIFFLRLFYPHKVNGRENVHLDKDTPCIFISNHGEIYGPVANVLFLPYTFRPWTISEMMDRKIIADNVCDGFFANQKVLPKGLLHFIVDKIAAPFLAWVMRSVESIPVYRDNPRKLMLTFRETVAAMEAGDNILIFPENSLTTEDKRYQKEGVSEFFTGFTMVAQLYYNRTGKAPLFIPLYANKKKRTITFGNSLRYDPENNPNDEKERICTTLRDELIRLSML